MDSLIPIGRFSRITRLSIRALRRYDEMGVLQPAWVDPSSGYRYYRLGQARDAEAVRILRGLDMPIAQIREVLAAGDPDLVRKHLALHREHLEERLVEHQRRLAFLERVIDREDGVLPYDVIVREVSAVPVIALRRQVQLEELGAAIGEAVDRLRGDIAAARQVPAGPPVVVYHDELNEETEGQIEVCVPVPPAVEGRGDLYRTEVPGGMMATTLHRGPYNEIQPAYHSLVGWIQEHGHDLAGPPRETYLNDPTEVDSTDLETEIAWPIR